jgi:hypothetical protein
MNPRVMQPSQIYKRSNQIKYTQTVELSTELRHTNLHEAATKSQMAPTKTDKLLFPTK